jgi:hypothetical protein
MGKVARIPPPPAALTPAELAALVTLAPCARCGCGRYDTPRTLYARQDLCGWCLMQVGLRARHDELRQTRRRR